MLSNAIPNLSDHLYRKQFFYGPEKASYAAWNFLKMPGDYWLSFHPELNVYQHQSNGFVVALLGFILDPDRPSDNDEQILNRLCQTSSSMDEFMMLTETLGGRWILFVHRNDSSIVFNDAGGTRTIFYHLDENQRMWLATQPGLLGELLGFAESEESLALVRSPEFQKRLEAWWPGESSPYTQVKQMLPNHYLDMKDKKVKRFWPNEPLQKLPLTVGVTTAGNILKGIVESAYKRFPLSVSLSSGLDSRMVLSACRDFAEDIQIFSLLYRKLNHESDDIRIPIEITRTLNLHHDLIDCRDKPDESFKQLFDQNVKGLNTNWVSIAYGTHLHLDSSRMVMKGTISEIMRCRYWSLGDYPYLITPEKVIAAMNMGNVPLVEQSLREWYADTIPMKKYRYKLLDLLSWENEVGNFYDVGYAIWDISHQEFTPFNTRRFFTTMLGIHPKYRSFPEHIAQRKITAYLWPELARFPYTPSRVIPQRHLLTSPFFNYLRDIKKSILQK